MEEQVDEESSTGSDIEVPESFEDDKLVCPSASADEDSSQSSIEVQGESWWTKRRNAIAWILVAMAIVFSIVFTKVWICNVGGFRFRIGVSSPTTLPLLDDPTTPQSRAFEWMTAESGLGLCSSRSLEQYALAVLHFSQWKNRVVESGPSTITSSHDDYPAMHRGESCRNSNCQYEKYSISSSCNVYCDTHPVTGLFFSGSNLTALPNEISLLTNLRALKFYKSIVGGTIPIEIGILQKLEQLDLGTEQESHPQNCNGGPECILLTGTIPTAMGLLTNLEVLALSGNALTGTVPTELGNLKSLKTVNIHRNCLTGYLPTAWTQLPNLTTMNSRQNMLDGYGPGFPFELAAEVPTEGWYTVVDSILEKNLCDCSRSNVECHGDDLYCPKIPPLCSRGPAGMCMSFLDRHPDCDYIPRPPYEEVSSCGASNSLPEPKNNSTIDRGHLSQLLLEKLPLNVTLLDDPMTPQGKALEWMLKNDTGLACRSDLSIQQRFILATLSFGIFYDVYSYQPVLNASSSECDWLSLWDYSEFACLHTGEVALIRIGKPFWYVDSHLPTEVALLTSLRSLQLQRGGSRNYTIPTDLGRLMNLTVLELGDSDSDAFPSSGGFPTEIYRLTNMKILTLAGNAGDGESQTIPDHIGDMSNLEKLTLRFKMHGTLPPSIGTLTSLREVIIESLEDKPEEGLDGPIPPSLFELPYLKNAFIRRQKFRSSIPTSIGSATNLEYLSLAECQLTGVIPTEIGHLTRLTSMGISQYGCHGGEFVSWLDYPSHCVRNSTLTGSLPTEFGALTRLVGLNLENQDMSGTVPPEWTGMGRLRSLSLAGNPKIVGKFPILRIPSIDAVEVGGTSMVSDDENIDFTQPGINTGYCPQDSRRNSELNQECYSFTKCWNSSTYWCRDLS